MSTNRKSKAVEFSRKVRSLRGHFARRHVANVAGVQLFVVCVMEHGKVHEAKVVDVVKVINTLCTLRVVTRKRGEEIYKLFRVLVAYKNKKTQERYCCHRRRHSVRR